MRSAAASGLGDIGKPGSLEKLFLALDRGNFEASGAIGKIVAPGDVKRLVGYLGRLPFHSLGPALAEVLQRTRRTGERQARNRRAPGRGRNARGERLFRRLGFGRGDALTPNVSRARATRDATKNRELRAWSCATADDSDRNASHGLALLADWRSSVLGCSGTPAAFGTKYPDNRDKDIEVLLQRINAAPPRKPGTIAVGITAAPSQAVRVRRGDAQAAVAACRCRSLGAATSPATPSVVEVDDRGGRLRPA